MKELPIRLGRAECPMFWALLEELPGLGVRPEDVLLMGSAALAARELRDVRDLDVLAPSGVVAALVTDGRAQPLGDPDCPGAMAVVTEVGMIQITDDVRNFSTRIETPQAELVERAEAWNFWRVISLEDLVVIKRALGRTKDLDDLELVAEYRRRGGS